MKCFVILLFWTTLFLNSCTAPSPTDSSVLVNTWIFNGEKITTNKSNYTVSDTRYDKYKYMDLYNNGNGSLWGGAAILDGKVSWNENAKIVELQAKNDGGALLNVEKYDIDSVSAFYLKMTYEETHGDTVISKELLFKR
ncbi:MAG: hypothetical protein ACO3EE_09170 [Flavobacteriales bacterium]